jgi:hypothetical protein
MLNIFCNIAMRNTCGHMDFSGPTFTTLAQWFSNVCAAESPGSLLEYGVVGCKASLIGECG